MQKTPVKAKKSKEATSEKTKTELKKSSYKVPVVENVPKESEMVDVATPVKKKVAKTKKPATTTTPIPDKKSLSLQNLNESDDKERVTADTNSGSKVGPLKNKSKVDTTSTGKSNTTADKDLKKPTSKKKPKAESLKRKAPTDTDSVKESTPQKKKKLNPGAQARKVAREEEQREQTELEELESSAPFTDLVYHITDIPFNYNLAQLKPILDDNGITAEFIKRQNGAVYCIVSTKHQTQLESLNGQTVGDQTLNFKQHPLVPSLTLQVLNFNPSSVSAADLKTATGCDSVRLATNKGYTLVEVSNKVKNARITKKIGKFIKLKGRKIIAEVKELKNGRLYEQCKKQDKRLFQLCIRRRGDVTDKRIQEVTHGRVIKTVETTSRAYLKYKERDSARKIARDVTLKVNGVEMEVSWTFGLLKEAHGDAKQERKLRLKNQAIEEDEERCTLEELERSDPFNDLVFSISSLPVDYPLTRLQKSLDKKYVRIEEFLRCSKFIYCVVKPDQEIILRALTGINLDGFKLSFRRSSVKPSLRVALRGYNPSRVPEGSLREIPGCVQVKTQRVGGTKAYVELDDEEQITGFGKEIRIGKNLMKVLPSKKGSLFTNCRKNGKFLVKLHSADPIKTTTNQIEASTGGRVIKLKSDETRVSLKFKDRASARKVVRGVALMINGVAMEACWDVDVVNRMEYKKFKESVDLPDAKFIISNLPAPYCTMRIKLLHLLQANNIECLNIVGRFDEMFCCVVIKGADRKKLLAMDGHERFCTHLRISWMYSPLATVLMSEVDTVLVNADNLKEELKAQGVTMLPPPGPRAIVLMQTVHDAQKLVLKKSITIKGCKMRLYRVRSSQISRAKVIFMGVDRRVVGEHDLLRIPKTVRVDMQDDAFGKAFVRFAKRSEADKLVKAGRVVVNGSSMLVVPCIEEFIVKTAPLYYYIGGLPLPLGEVRESLTTFFKQRLRVYFRAVKGDDSENSCYVTIGLADKSKMESGDGIAFWKCTLDIQQVGKIPDNLTSKSAKPALKNYKLDSSDDESLGE